MHRKSMVFRLSEKPDSEDAMPTLQPRLRIMPLPNAPQAMGATPPGLHLLGMLSE
jgi:hypothetical protein